MFRAIIALVMLCGAASSARALPEFPEELQKVTGAPCLPHCNVCHRDDNAGDGTVDKPFGLAMRAHGLQESLQSLDRAAANLKKAGTDSDGDEVQDIEELSQGDDPNDSYDASICGPQVGCSLEGGVLDAGPSIVALALLCVWLRKRPRAQA